jgi:hypothetical protein
LNIISIFQKNTYSNFIMEEKPLPLPTLTITSNITELQNSISNTESLLNNENIVLRNYIKAMSVSLNVFKQTMRLNGYTIPKIILGNWYQQGSDIYGEESNDNSGDSVSMNISGNRIAIGTVLNDGNGTDSGHVRVYEWNDIDWIQLGIDIDGEAGGDNSGYATDMNGSGNRIVIGAVYNNDAGIVNGHVRVYEWNGIAWIQLGVDIDGELLFDISGYSVSINTIGNRIALGAPYNDGNGPEAGHVRVYEWNNTAWIQLGVDIDGEFSGDNLGFDVSMNALGNRIIIGVPFNDFNGTNTGNVRVYEWDDIKWNQLGNTIYGELSEDKLGSFVDINAIGNIISISTPNGSSGGINNSHVKSYQLNGSTWDPYGDTIVGDSNGRKLSRVKLSDSGDKIAVSGLSVAFGSNYTGDGRVYAINTDTNTWDLLGDPIIGNVNDGYKDISINGDCTKIILGGTTGNVCRVYEIFESILPDII